MTTNPWIGLDSYREGQILYGRSREIRDLSMAVFYNRQTIVYGRSGTGKSSLLHAGIFPEARLRGCLPISIRFDHSSDTNYREQLIRTITAAIEAAGGEVRDLLEENHQPESLWEFFHRYRFLRDGKSLTPLLVVDQFEEIFTLSHKKEDVQRFFTELGDLLNDVMPDYLQQTAVASASTDTTSIFGNMTFQSMESRYLTDPPYHLVLVLRDDYLSYLERYSQRIPALKQNRYGLMPITYQQALEIIMQPRPGLVSSEVADAIIRHIVTETDLNDETPVDAAILSLFLSRLYEKKGDNPVINLQLVNEQGEALLKDFYAEVVAPLDRTTVHFLENVLINQDGHRENISLENLYVQGQCDKETIDALEKSHLLRLFSYGDVQRVEFAHDVLCPIIVQRKEQRKNEARYRRSQRRSLIGYFLAFVLFFGVIFAIAYISDWVDSIKKERARLFEMETSMVTRASQQMLDEHDIYGAIRLLINSMPDDLDNLSDGMIAKERLLRQAVDSLMHSENRIVAMSQWITMNDMISRNEILFCSTDYCYVDVYDVNTGAFVQSFSFKEDDSEKIFFYTETKKNRVHWHRERSHGIRLLDIGVVLPTILLAVDDTTLLECYIRETWDNPSYHSYDCGKTRMAFMYNDTILDARYNLSGDSIAVLLADSTTYLYSAQNGMELKRDSSAALAIIHSADLFQKKYIQSICYAEDEAGSYWSCKMYVNDKTYKDGYLVDSNRLEFIRPSFVELASITVEEDMVLRNWINSLPASYYISQFRNSYYWTQEEYYKYIREDTIIGSAIKYPYAISKDRERLFFAIPQQFRDIHLNDLPLDLYGYYPKYGEYFLKTNLKMTYSELKTINLTDDEQEIVINAGEENQMVIPVLRLPDLIEECKAMFFDWQMSDEERYNLYSKMND